MKREGKTLKEFCFDLPRFHLVESTIPGPEDLKRRVWKHVESTYPLPEDLEPCTVDGFKVTHPDDSWFLVRASGTESTLRLYAESSNPNEATRLLEVVTNLTQAAIDAIPTGGDIAEAVRE